MIQAVVLTTLFVALSTPVLAIVGGGATNGNFYDFNVAIMQPALKASAPTTLICGGVLVGPSTVLTIAECVVGIGADNAVVRAGVSSNGYQTLNVTNITIHPEYNGTTLANDIAILQLQAQIQNVSSANIAPADWGMPDRNQSLVGWGSTQNNTQGSSASQQSVVVPPLAIDPCRNYLSTCNYTLNEQQHYCTALEGKGAAYGDAGGPVVNPDGIVVGLISGSPLCAQPNGLALELRVSHFSDWIKNNTATAN